MIGLEYLLRISLASTLAFSISFFFAPAHIKGKLAALAIIVNAVLTSWLAFPALLGNTTNISLAAGSFFDHIPIRIDALSAWFILIINFTCITGVVYGGGYLKTYENDKSNLTLHWVLFVLFHLSMIWVCMLQNSFAFLIAWEIMSLSSMMLVIFDYTKAQTIKAGINYLVQMHISVVLISVGFIWVYFQTGSFSFDAIGTFFSTQNNIGLFLIFFLGFGFKAGFIPLHSWLPQAHPAAPSHVSGVMSGVIVKLGIYGIFRIISMLKFDFIILGEIVLITSVITGLYGILNAAVYRDFKKMLAYCTIENIGIIGIGMGMGLIGIGNDNALLYYAGFGGALLHVLNHSLFKSLLFYSAGSVYQQTHTRDIEKLGGLIKQMPKTAVLFLIGAIAIGGIPPLNGFVSEFIIYSGLLEGIQSNSLSQTILIILSITGLSIIGGISIFTFTKTFGTIFLGTPRQHLHITPQEVSLTMRIPQYLIIVVMLSIALFPELYLTPINNLLSGFSPKLMMLAPLKILRYSTSIANISLCATIFLGIVIVSWGIRYYFTQHKSQQILSTWGCGYIAPNKKMQYTGRSFSKPLAKIFSFLIIEKKRYKELNANEIFPKTRRYESMYFDFFEYRFFDTLSHRLVYITTYFKFIQNGRVQSYVLYGVVFIVAIFFLTIFNLI